MARDTDRAAATFKRMIEKETGKSLNDPTLTMAEVDGAIAVIQAQAVIFAAERKGPDHGP